MKVRARGMATRCRSLAVACCKVAVDACFLSSRIDCTGRDCSSSTTSVDHRGPPSISRRVGYPQTEQMSRKRSRKVRETRSSYSRKRPERGQKCRQRLELGIQGLKNWGRNWSRKVRETRSSSSQKRSEPAAHPCRGPGGQAGRVRRACDDAPLSVLVRHCFDISVIAFVMDWSALWGRLIV